MHASFICHIRFLFDDWPEQQTEAKKKISTMVTRGHGKVHCQLNVVLPVVVRLMFSVGLIVPFSFLQLKKCEIWNAIGEERYPWRLKRLNWWFLNYDDKVWCTTSSNTFESNATEWRMSKKLRFYCRNFINERNSMSSFQCLFYMRSRYQRIRISHNIWIDANKTSTPYKRKHERKLWNFLLPESNYWTEYR